MKEFSIISVSIINIIIGLRYCILIYKKKPGDGARDQINFGNSYN